LFFKFDLAKKGPRGKKKEKKKRSKYPKFRQKFLKPPIFLKKGLTGS
jgi:hypothetical protein